MKLCKVVEFLISPLYEISGLDLITCQLFILFILFTKHCIRYRELKDELDKNEAILFPCNIHSPVVRSTTDENNPFLSNVTG